MSNTTRSLVLPDGQPQAQRGSSRRPRQTFAYVFMVIVVLLMLLPFVWMISGSLKAQAEFLINPGGWLPWNPTLENYVVLFRDKGFLTYFLNSTIVSAAVVGASVLFSAMGGYALAHLEFRGKRFVFGCVMVAMAMPYVAVFVPQFLIVVQLGLVNTLAGIAAPMLITPISMFIMRQYAYSIPGELLEAARIDGAGEVGIFARIFLPLCGPALATSAILSFLIAWNNFLWPLIVAQAERVYTLPVGLAAASQESNTQNFGILLAGAVVILLPVLLLFLFLQRYFIQGVAATGLK